MTRVGRYENPYIAFEMAQPPAGAGCELLTLVTEDRAACHAALWSPANRRATTCVLLMHPRADFLRHYAIPFLLSAGYGVLAANSRAVGNDSMLIHERILLDVAACMIELRRRGFDHIVGLGNSGGGSLLTFYQAEAQTDPERRLRETAAGEAFDLSAFHLPTFDALVLLAAHPGEGLFLMHAIDPSVTDEGDPLSCDPAIDMYDARNGFRPPPTPSRYDPEFVRRYRAAQRARVERLDSRARAILEARREARRRARSQPQDTSAARQATAMPFFTIYRTEADLRYVDPSLDPSDRDTGSLFGVRPDLINYGPFGFARVVTPDAWLSTWSGLSSYASIPTQAPRVTVPALVVSYTGDNAVFPSDAAANLERLGSTDKSRLDVRADHYGHALAKNEPEGRKIALTGIIDWLRARFFT